MRWARASPPSRGCVSYHIPYLWRVYINLLNSHLSVCPFCCRDGHGYADTSSGRQGGEICEGFPWVSLSPADFVPLKMWCRHCSVVNVPVSKCYAVYEACPESIQPFWIHREPVVWPWYNLAASQRRP
jgi:hypothetical protein